MSNSMTPARLHDFFHTGRLTAIALAYEARSRFYTSEAEWIKYAHDLTEAQRQESWEHWYHAKQYIVWSPDQLEFDFKQFTQLKLTDVKGKV